MARSARYCALLPRLTELRRHLLPADFDPTRPYSGRQVDRIRGYRLLAHAEFESCIEDLVTETVTAAWVGWKADRQPRTCLIALVAYYEGSLGGLPETLTPTQRSKKVLVHLVDRVDKARNHHVTQVVRKNNGIKESNLLSLLLPVGVRQTDLDKTWLATINSFGSTRGETAHQSGRTQQPPDPQLELQTVREIATGLARLDRTLTSLRVT